MKIMTLNAHSHGAEISEDIFQENLAALAECIIRQQVDVIALQEVCQTMGMEAVEEKELQGFIPSDSQTVIRRDNYVLGLIRKLRQEGRQYYWTWDGIKAGYEIYDEGLAVISRFPIECVEEYYLSNQRDYQNWKTRKAIAAEICVDGEKSWFVSTHMGWWEDEEEPFAGQMDRLMAKLSHKKCNIYLMGDFNSQADEKHTGYDYVKTQGWTDIWLAGGNREHEITVPGKIDGWGKKAEKGLCIDYIWSKYPVETISSRVVFSGETEPVISDHYGILSDICRKQEKKGE